MKHDYDLPRNWQDFSDQEKHNWYCSERARRQALRQTTETAEILYNSSV